MKWYLKIPEWIRWILFIPLLILSGIIAIFITEIICRFTFNISVIGWILPKKYHVFLIYMAVEPVKAALVLIGTYYLIPRWNKIVEKIVYIILLVVLACGPLIYLIHTKMFHLNFISKSIAENIGYIIAIPIVIGIHSIIKKE